MGMFFSFFFYFHLSMLGLDTSPLLIERFRSILCQSSRHELLLCNEYENHMPFKAWFFQCHQRHSLALIFSSLILLAMITACSFTYVYPRIDAFALWKIDDYITLNGRQEDWLELRLQQALRWHHTEQLPRWQDWLIVFRADIANGKMNPKRYSSHVVELRALLNDTSSGLIDDATNLIKTLSNEQIDELEQELQKNLDDYEERNLERSKEEHQARLSEKTSDNLVDWFGNLNNDQKALVRNYAENLPDGRVLAITARQRWLLHLKQVLAMRAQQDSLSRHYKPWFYTPKSCVVINTSSG